ncbi:hypothetical protein M0811_02790 [Anaeramoeba ignava]|uniref:Uncharacterized protein n=1 Tax=Anaeramoeba ignava TaxID=1746090 RepID=A0A9Q0R502_ANAIG|nr:hypothetical protein M0811_02790 [Anaeramoeba ignava]
MNKLKCIIIGDTTVGKTSLAMTFSKNGFPKETIPSVYENFTKDFVIEGNSINLTIYDTHCDPDYDKLRPLIYQQTDVFMICFSLVSEESFVHVKTKWVPEVRKLQPKARSILVGTKMDLRNDPQTIKKLEDVGLSPITQQSAMDLAYELGSLKYVECSAFTQKDLSFVFEEAIRAVTDGPPPKSDKKSKCFIL